MWAASAHRRCGSIVRRSFCCKRRRGSSARSPRPRPRISPPRRGCGSGARGWNGGVCVLMIKLKLTHCREPRCHHIRPLGGFLTASTTANAALKGFCPCFCTILLPRYGSAVYAGMRKGEGPQRPWWRITTFSLRVSNDAPGARAGTPVSSLLSSR